MSLVAPNVLALSGRAACGVAQLGADAAGRKRLRMNELPLVVADITFSYHSAMNAKHRKTLAAIFARPTSASIVFADIEALVKALGGCVSEREGSRVKIELKGEQWRCHRPHPGKEAKRYQVDEARELLERAGVQP